MGILDIFKAGEYKRELEKAREGLLEVRKILAETSVLDEVQRRDRLKALEMEIASREQLGIAKTAELAEFDRQLAAKKTDIIEIEDRVLLQEFGLYQPKYNLADSAAYKAMLDDVQNQQAAAVKNGGAVSSDTEWTVNNSKAEGQRMIRDYSKLIVRAFNNECDWCIANVKFHNIESARKRIRKSFAVLNKLGSRMKLSVTESYLNLKLRELEVAFEYQLKRQQEKEEQKRVREMMREEARVQKEIEEARDILRKEERHFENALTKLTKQLDNARNETEASLYVEEIRSINEKLVEVQEQKKAVDYREANARAGYVYIISNIGAFGEEIFKIGVTRRLEPLERIDELGDASVPFGFDVHALVFSDDAFALEAALHAQFSERRVNRINMRKEFFRTTLDEVEKILMKNFSKPVEIHRLAEADEFRQTQKLLGLAG